jgi:hypothetical protein
MVLGSSRDHFLFNRSPDTDGIKVVRVERLSHTFRRVWNVLSEVWINDFHTGKAKLYFSE